MMQQALQDNIPTRIRVFPKLTADHDPYFFDSWDRDNQEAILRYWFWNRDKTKKNKKRVFVQEIAGLVRNKSSGEEISRSDFERYCPRTRRDGGCGFAVIIRILEHLGIVIVNQGKYMVATNMP